MKLTCSRLCVLSMLLVTAAEFAAAQPGSSAIKAQLPKELKQKVNLGESREQRLIQLLERLAKKSGVRIGFDHAGLEKLCKKSLQEVVIVPPPGTLPLGAAIELVASQIHGTLQERNRQWQIVPGHADISRFVSPATVQTQTAFLKMAEIERPVQAPAKDIVEFFGEKYEMRIVIASGPFDSRVKFGDNMCQLPAGKRPLNELVREVAKQIQGQVRVYEELILIVP